MPKLIQQIEINIDAETIFDYTQNYDKRLEWDTFLIQANLINSNKAELGGLAYCVSKQGMGMETKYVSFNRPKVTAITMTKGPKMFKSFAGSWQYKTITPTLTKVVFTYSFEFNFPFRLGSYYIQWVLNRNVKQRLLDLKNCLEN